MANYGLSNTKIAKAKRNKVADHISKRILLRLVVCFLVWSSTLFASLIRTEVQNKKKYQEKMLPKNLNLNCFAFAPRRSKVNCYHCKIALFAYHVIVLSIHPFFSFSFISYPNPPPLFQKSILFYLLLLLMKVVVLLLLDILSSCYYVFIALYYFAKLKSAQEPHSSLLQCNSFLISFFLLHHHPNKINCEINTSTYMIPLNIYGLPDPLTHIN